MKRSIVRGAAVCGCLLALLLSAVAWADAALPSPEGRVILTVSGKIAHTNDGDSAKFDRAMLESLGQSELAVTTPWTDGTQQFKGVLGRLILDAVGADGTTITAYAVNDYQITIPVSDLRDYPVLFALQQNGRYMRVRDKGPIWVVYPRETYPELDTDLITDRWIWQLKALVIE